MFALADNYEAMPLVKRLDRIILENFQARRQTLFCCLGQNLLKQ